MEQQPFAGCKRLGPSDAAKNHATAWKSTRGRRLRQDDKIADTMSTQFANLARRVTPCDIGAGRHVSWQGRKMGSYLQQLPAEVARLIETAPITEYATVSAAGVPIDTPLLVFTSADLASIDVATGLAYPVKAERARRNPKVGLLLEGGPGRPVVSVAGMAAVRDADLQANMNRYVAETIPLPLYSPDQVDYQAITRKAVWYFTRMIVQVAPAHIRWWPNPEAMDDPPQEWRAPAGAVFPASDPAPGGEPSKPSPWPQRPWRELVEPALAKPGHLTLLDDEGFPLPIRARGIVPTEDGFRLTLPKAAPWTRGKATLSFLGQEIFVGEAERDGPAAVLKVERALPILPLAADMIQVILPKPDVQASLMARLEHETKRRGQPIPAMPAEPPEPTAGARKRAAAMVAYTEAAQRNELA
jgi:hypothetical protein